MCARSASRRSAPTTIRRAAAVHPISDLQIEYSLISRGIEDAILPACRALGIGITAYGVLSRGLISGHWRKDAAGAGDFRAHSPRFQGDNAERNLALVESAAAGRREPRASASPSSPSPGWRRRARTSCRWSAPAAATGWPRRSARSTLRLAPADLAAIEAAVPKGAAAGERYAPAQMAQLDSERPVRAGGAAASR